MASRPIRVLFVCTHNSARSQMAEGLLRHLGGNAFEVASAGTEPTRLNPFAVQAMAKLHLDIAGARAKHVAEFVGQPWDYVITVCDDARERCPVFPGDTERIHWTYPDPSAVEGTDAERQHAFDVVAADLMSRLRLWIEVAKRVQAGTA
jgi:arsenate reductase